MFTFTAHALRTLLGYEIFLCCLHPSWLSQLLFFHVFVVSLRRVNFQCGNEGGTAHLRILHAYYLPLAPGVCHLLYFTTPRVLPSLRHSNTHDTTLLHMYVKDKNHWMWHILLGTTPLYLLPRVPCNAHLPMCTYVHPTSTDLLFITNMGLAVSQNPGFRSHYKKKKNII